jgi:hypothetical protein
MRYSVTDGETEFSAVTAMQCAARKNAFCSCDDDGAIPPRLRNMPRRASRLQQNGERKIYKRRLYGFED